MLAAALGGDTPTGRLERELQQVETRLAGLGPDDPETARLTERYGELRHRFEALDGDRLEARARTILSGLGVPQASFGRSLEELSGGWRMRVVLARLLLGNPRLLLLDEPTNHLDLEAIGWLEEFLSTYEGAFVVVSHDRYFLNRMVRCIAELDRGRLTEYAGGYDEYIDEREAREQALEKAAKQQARELVKTERFIERFRYKNTKARQVQSRIRALSKLDRVQVTERSKRIRFGFPPAPRSGDVVVQAEGVHKAFGDNRVYDGLDLLLRRGDRVALVGPNGAGNRPCSSCSRGVSTSTGARCVWATTCACSTTRSTSWTSWTRRRLRSRRWRASPRRASGCGCARCWGRSCSPATTSTRRSPCCPAENGRGWRWPNC